MSSRSSAPARTSATGRRRLRGSRAASPRAAVSSPGRSPRRADYPNPDDPDLLRVSQYFDAVLGEAPLYEKLHDVFDADYPPSSLHRLLAASAGAPARGGAEEQLLVLTTNYDDLVERALEEAGEPFDVVWYEAKPGPQPGPLLASAAGRESRCRSRSRTSTPGSRSPSGR